MSKVKLNKDDFSILTLCAFRYALGRMTYIPDIVADIIRYHKKDLDVNDITIIIKEINECKNYGMKIDKETWLDLAKELEEYEGDD